MIRTIEAVFDAQGRLILPPGTTSDGQRHRAVVLILDEAPAAESIPAPPSAPSTETESVGDQRYLLLDRIGAGGMGEVFRAFDQRTRSIVCLKRLHAGVNPAALRQEGSALRRLLHPNILGLLDDSFEPSDPFLVTEFVDGPDLASWLRVRRRVPVLLAADLVRQILDGLAFAHSQHVIHCDLKPGNVMVELDGARLVPRILDFGLAVVDHRDDQGAITAEGRVAGTYSYMAPEQFLGQVLTPACDVYAAGLMLAQMITGENPYGGRGVDEIVGVKLSVKSGLKLDAGSAERSILDLIESCTRPEPAARPSALEAVAVLHRLTTGLRHPLWPINLDFTRGLAGWGNGIGKVGDASPNYAAHVVLDTNGAAGGVTLESLTDSPSQFGVLVQSFPADRLIGERLRLEADVATRGVTGRAALWLRVDSPSNSLALDNMGDDPITGTTDARRVRLEMRVPDGAATIHFGLLLAGTGSMTVGPLSLTLQAGQEQFVLALG
jgi:serine/threonine protein kinase